MSPSAPTSVGGGLDLSVLADWARAQRWYGAKSRPVRNATIADAAAVRGSAPLLLVLLELALTDGGTERYQVPILFGGASERVARGTIQAGDGWVAYDALAEPGRVRPLLAAMERDERIETDAGTVSFERTERLPAFAADVTVRPVGVEQSNSSLVFGESTVLKVFRRLEPGVNPELEVLRFLTRRGFGAIAPLHGAYEYRGADFAATLGVAQRFVADATGGWELVLARIAADPDGVVAQLGALGTVTADLHNALASDADDPDFAPAPTSAESLGALRAAIDEDVERTFVRLPDEESVAAIVGRSPELHARIAERSRASGGGCEIRTHGDFHLGQTLHGPDGWVIIDFEGEPARPLSERRAKRSPLRDVASMLRSFAYAASAAGLHAGQAVSADFEEQARTRYLDAYLERIEARLVPRGDAEVHNLLALFELEKLVYELRYELDNRPDWLPIPVAGIRRLLEAP